jgi:MFS family permease
VTAAASALMAASPAGSFAVVGAATVLGAAGSAVILPHADTLVMNCLDEADRAKGLSVYYVVLFSLSAPFGWIGGVLFDASGRLPFAAAAAILLAALCLCRLLPRRPPDPREE